ncbi:MAG TPA: FMN-binding glutamate synthase family protein, partial [Alteromonas sp.]|nr:FMN-binding glutamate synthase family protein [Alteromonas sp.]
MRQLIFTYLIAALVISIVLSLWLPVLWWLVVLSGGLLGVAIYDARQHKHSLLVNFPL